MVEKEIQIEEYRMKHKLKIQKFLRENSLVAAVEKWNLKVSEEGNLVQLNYNMIDSPRGVSECDECRGLILDRSNDWAVVAYPFRRFYNIGETQAVIPDLKTSVLWEKMDGTLINLFFWDGEWRVSTRGMPFANGPVGDYDQSYSDLFLETSDKYPKIQRMREDWTDKNFIFELIGPKNRVVTPYKEADIRLLTVRDLSTLGECDWSTLCDWSQMLGVPLPRIYSFSDLDDLEALMELNEIGELDEGFVLVDTENADNGSWRRVKIKNPSYFAVAKLVGNGPFSGRRALELVMQGEDTVVEFLAYFPEYSERILGIQVALNKLIKRAEDDIEKLVVGDPEDREQRKSMALAIQREALVPSIVFRVMGGRSATVKESIFGTMPRKLMEILDEVGMIESEGEDS